jgi:hypothetical protein
MSSEYTFNIGQRKVNRGKLPGMIMTIIGGALVTWFVFDSILIAGDYRVAYLTDLESAARLVIGVITIFGGLLAWKWDEIGTSMP